MKLDVIPNPTDPWYAEGLKFTCTQCGDCCTGGPGYVWVTPAEVHRLAAHLRLSVEETLSRYCRKVGSRISFKERRMPSGDHDCVFLTQIPAAPGGESKELAPGEPIPLPRRGCSIYPVRPLQCRTWPFWPENIASQAAWTRTARKCPGINHGRRTFTPEQIEAIRDADEWPADPPTSAGNEGRGHG